MKHTFILLLLCISFGAANAQFTIKKTIKPKNEFACDGKLVLEFIQSELPAELVISSPMLNQNFTVDSKLFTIPSLCPGMYTIEMTDNHECVTEKEVDLEECDMEISYEVKRYDCNENAEKYDIALIDLPEGQLYYEWNNGSTKSYQTRQIPGDYSVTVTDENGCKQEFSMSIESTKVSISNTIDPSENGDGCDGRVSIQSEAENETFTITLIVNFESVYSEVVALDDQEFQIPVDLCYYNTNTVEIEDKYGCTQELDIELSFLDCSNLKLKIDELWHASNWDVWDNGKVKYKFLAPNLDPDEFEFKLYKECPTCSSGWILVESGIGKTEFNGLEANCDKYDWEECEFDDFWQEIWNQDLSYWKCNYKIVTQSISNDDCKSVEYFTIRQCSNDKDIFLHSKTYTDEEGNVHITFNQNSPIFNVNSANLSYIVTGPNGEINSEMLFIVPNNAGEYYIYPYPYTNENVPDFCNDARLGFAIDVIANEEGEYCLTVDNGCGEVAELCKTIVSCNESIDFTDSPQYVYPSNRDNSALGEGHENIEKAFTASSVYTNCSSDYEKHTDNHCPTGCTEDDKFYFIYVPDNIENPCAGGIVAMYDFKEEDGVDKVFPNLSKEINFPADYQFDWTNNVNEDVTSNLHAYNYAHISQAVNPDEQICKDGTYCLYEASKIFPEFITSKYILLSVCKEDLVDVCAVYPYADICAPDPCYNGVQDGTETEVDCGGNCPPCDEDPIDDQCVPPCDNDEECVGGECLKKCNDTTEPCPDGKVCNDDGVCVDDDDTPPDNDCEFCEDKIGGECIDDVCYVNICNFSLYVKNEDINNDPDLNFEFFLNHNLETGDWVEVVPGSVSKGSGLSLTITQDGNELYNYNCNPADPTDALFALISSSPLTVSVQPNNYGETDECSGNNKDEVGFDINCDPGKAEIILSSSIGGSNILKVYPNPFQDQIYIESAESDIESIKVYNSIGTLVKKINDINSLKYSLETEQMTPGIYILNIESNSENSTIKVLKI